MSARELIAERASASGYEVALTPTTLTLEGPRTMSLDLTEIGRLAVGGPEAEKSRLLDLHHGLPGRARGDQRELLIAAIVRDAAPGAPSGAYQRLHTALSEEEGVEISDRVQRNVLADVMREHYWVKPRTGRSDAKTFVFPFNAALPANFSQRGTYKMFRSDILLFLCWDGARIDPAPVAALCKLLSSRKDLTLLDELLLDAAIRTAGDGAITEITPESLLTSQQADKVRGYLADGPFLPEAHQRFREDLLAALSMPLPRHDLVEAAILTISLHLAIYYYRLSFALGRGLDDAMAAASGIPLETRASFDGALRFRVATSGARPVRRDSGCAAAWRQLDDRYLITLTPNIVVANLLHEAWRAAATTTPAQPDPAALAEAMRADPELATAVDLAAGALAAAYAERSGSPGALLSAADTDPGIYALRQVITEHQRRPPHTKTRSSTLHYRSRAVVNQLVKRPFGGSLIRTRGSVIFFELDEAFLFLLVRFVIQRAGQEELPFRSFLEALATYGLAPQDEREEAELEGVLERLGMLQRYSDAGEAVYVRHLF